MTVKSCEKLEKSRVALTIETSAEEFEAAVNKAYLKMRGKINVPGFRVGKAPRKIIEKMYGAEVFYEEAVNIILPDAYEAAVKEQELNVVGYPEVELESCTKDGVVFKCTVAVYPEVKLGQYKGLEAPKAEVKVAAADVNARLKEMADRNSRLVSVDRAVNDEPWSEQKYAAALAAQQKENALLAGVLTARGITDPTEALTLLAGEEELSDPALLTDMDKACERIWRAIDEGETIVVFGDYDVDGITATCLLTDFLRGIGADCVVHIPGRLEEGYGLNAGAIRQLRAQGVRLIITVDCGITALAAARSAATAALYIASTSSFL